MKHGSFDMILKAKNEVCNGNNPAGMSTIQESSHVEITNEAMLITFFHIKVLLTLNSFR
jgi:hypothetical protein